MSKRAQTDTDSVRNLLNLALVQVGTLYCAASDWQSYSIGVRAVISACPTN